MRVSNRRRSFSKRSNQSKNKQPLNVHKKKHTVRGRVPTLQQVIRKDQRAVRHAIIDKQTADTVAPHVGMKQLTPWKNIPEKDVSFCTYWIKHKISKPVMDKCYHALEIYAKRVGIDENLEHMTPERLLKLFTAVDIIWFGGVLRRYISRKNIKQECGTSPHPSSKNTAGYCKWSWSKKMGIQLKINMCKPVLCERELFPTTSQLDQGTHSPKRYQVGGVLCSTPLECMLQAFVHEMTHAIVQMFCPERKSHGPVFRLLVKSIFGQETSTHGLGTRLGKTSGFRGKHVSEYKRFVMKHIKKGDKVTFYNRKQKLKGVFLGKSKKNRAIVLSGYKLYSDVPWDFITIVK